AKKIWAYGGAGNDNLSGAALADRLEGGIGNDYAYGRDGDDLIRGGDGGDYLYGHAGADVLHGEVGADWIDAGSDNDTIYGGDEVRSSSSSSSAWAATGLAGGGYYDGAGGDYVLAGSGSDWIDAQGGNDYVDAGADHDTILPGLGNDYLVGNTGDDVYQFAGQGNQGIDIVEEAATGGTDTLDFSLLRFRDTTNNGVSVSLTVSAEQTAQQGTGAGTADLLKLRLIKLAGSTLSEIESVVGSPLNDKLVGSTIVNTLRGGQGLDKLYGGDGNDLLYGEEDADELYGENGTDFMDGGPGINQLLGGAGFDYPEYIDNSQAGFTTTGSWAPPTPTPTPPEGLHGNQLVAGGSGTSATWTFASVPAGTYGVMATWTGNDSTVRNGTFAIKKNPLVTLGTEFTEQISSPTGAAQHGQPWQLLGEYVLAAADTPTVVFSGGTNNKLADAVWLVAKPTTTGISNVTIAENAGDHVISLSSVFVDPQETGIPLELSIEHLSSTSLQTDNWELFEGINVDSVTQTLTLDLAEDRFGTASITVRATNAAGLSVATTFTVTVTSADLAATFGQVDILNDAGASAIDRITGDPIIAGVVRNDDPPAADGSHLSQVFIEFDRDGNGTTDASVTADAGGQFYYTAPAGSYGNFKVRTREPNSAGGASVTSSWTLLPTFTISGAHNATPTLTSIGLVNDTGTSSTDRITRDPTVRGTIVNDNLVVSLAADASAALILDADYNGDGTADQSVALSLGSPDFQFVPNNPPNNVDLPIRLRVREWNRVTNAYMTPAAWTTAYTIRYKTTESDTAPNLVASLVGAFNGADRYDPSIAGIVTNDGLRDGIVVQIDYADAGTDSTFAADADVVIDDSTIVDAEGAFTFFPKDREYGLNGVRLRAVEHTYGETDPIYSSWVTLTFDLKAPPKATVGALTLVNDTGVAADKITYDSTVQGSIATSALFKAGSKIEFDWNGDSLPDGSTTAAANGSFSHTLPIDVAGAVAVRARVVQDDKVADEELVGTWNTGFSFTYEPWTGPTVTNFVLKNNTGNPNDALTTDATVKGDVSAPATFELAYSNVEFDYDADGVADESTLADVDGQFEYLPSTNIRASQVAQGSAFNLRARAAARNSSGVPVTGPWTTTSLTFTLEATTAPTVTLGLANDTAPGGDNQTTDPTLTGVVGTGVEFAYTTIELDFNQDGVADATTVADDAGVFFYRPPDLQLGAVVAKARAVTLDQVEDEVRYGAWATKSFTLLELTTDANITVIDENDQSATEAARRVTSVIAARGVDTAAAKARDQYHTWATSTGQTVTNSSNLDALVGLVPLKFGTRNGIVPDVGSYNTRNGLISSGGYQPVFSPQSLLNYIDTDVNAAAQNFTINVQDTAVPGETSDLYDLTGTVVVDVDYVRTTPANTYTLSISVTYTYQYVEWGAYSSTDIYGENGMGASGATHTYTHTQNGVYSVVFTAAGTFVDNGNRIKVTGKFDVTEDVDYTFGHTESVTYNYSTSGRSWNGSVGNSMMGQYHFDHHEWNTASTAFSADDSPNVSSAAGSFSQTESGFTNLVNNNSGSYSYGGLANSYNSNSLSRTETRNFGYSYQESGSYSLNNGSRSVTATQLAQNTTYGYRRDVNETVGFAYNHAGRSETGAQVHVESNTHDQTQSVAGRYTWNGGNHALTLSNVFVQEAGTESDVRTEAGTSRYFDNTGFDAGAYGRTDSSSQSWSYTESYAAGTSYVFTNLAGTMSGAFSKNTGARRSLTFNQSGSRSFNDGTNASDGAFDRTASLSASSTLADWGSYSSVQGVDVTKYAAGAATRQDGTTVSYSQAASYTFSYPGDTTRSGRGKVKASGVQSSSYSESASYTKTPTANTLSVIFTSSDNASSNMNLDGVVVTVRPDEKRTTRSEESASFSYLNTDNGSYIGNATTVANRTGVSTRTEKNQSNRQTRGSGTYTIAATAQEIHAFFEDETTDVSTSLSDTATYAQTASTEISNGTNGHRETRNTVMSLTDTIGYDRPDREGAANVQRDDVASYSYSDSGSYTVDASGNVSVGGSFRRTTTNSMKQGGRDEGDHQGGVTAGTFDNLTDAASTNSEVITGGQYTENNGARTESGNFARQETRYGYTDSKESTTVTANSSASSTTTTLNAHLMATSEVFYKESGTFADSPGTQSRTGTYSRTEKGNTIVNAAGGSSFKNTSAGGPGEMITVQGSSSFTEMVISDRKYEDEGGFSETNGAVNKAGWFQLKENGSTINETTDDNTVDLDGTASNGRTTNHSQVNTESETEYSEYGGFSDNGANINRHADFRRTTNGTRDEDLRSDVAYSTSLSVGTATFTDQGKASTYSSDDGAFSTTGSSTTRNGRSVEKESGKVKFKISDSGRYRGDQDGAYSSLETGTRSENFEQRNDYSESAGALKQSGSYSTRNGEQAKSEMAGQGKISSSDSSGTTTGGFKTGASGTRRSLNSEQGHFKITPSGEAGGSTFSNSDENDATESYQQSTSFTSTTQFGTVEGSHSVSTGSTTSDEYAGSGTQSDAGSQHTFNTSYRSKSTSNASESSSESVKQMFSSSGWQDGGMLQGYWATVPGNISEFLVGLYKAPTPTTSTQPASGSYGGSIVWNNSSNATSTSVDEITSGVDSLINGVASSSQNFISTSDGSSNFTGNKTGNVSHTFSAFDDHFAAPNESVSDRHSATISETQTNNNNAESSSSGVSTSGPSGVSQSASYSTEEHSNETYVQNNQGGRNWKHTLIPDGGAPSPTTTTTATGTFVDTASQNFNYDYVETGSYSDNGNPSNHSSVRNISQSNSFAFSTHKSEGGTVTHDRTHTGTATATYGSALKRIDTGGWQALAQNGAITQNGTNVNDQAPLTLDGADSATTIMLAVYNGETLTNTTTTASSEDDPGTAAAGWLDTALDWLSDPHNALDLAGWIPVYGEVFDAINVGLYLYEGDYKNAALSAISLVPVVG
ncbi:MAG: hypothetical protein SGJ19_10395, partial [Planctomycetia bacterium]|nr:hypothetical protein [Planctomycetia bacterium]